VVAVAVVQSVAQVVAVVVEPEDIALVFMAKLQVAVARLSQFLFQPWQRITLARSELVVLVDLT
jgi:hypothetical protein